MGGANGGDGYGRCPRCGLRIDNVIVVRRGKRGYLVAYHSSRTTGGRPKYCYLGPAGAYVHVSRMYGVDIMSPFFQDYYAIAFWAFLMLDDDRKARLMSELGWLGCWRLKRPERLGGGARRRRARVDTPL